MTRIHFYKIAFPLGLGVFWLTSWQMSPPHVTAPTNEGQSDRGSKIHREDSGPNRSPAAAQASSTTAQAGTDVLQNARVPEGMVAHPNHVRSTTKTHFRPTAAMGVKRSEAHPANETARINNPTAGDSILQLSDEDSADLTAHSATIAQPTGGISTNVPSEILATEPLPVAFLVDEADSAEFSAEEDRIILAVQSQFVNELGEITDNSAITDPVYRAEWNRARWNADNQLRLELGGVGFNQFNSLAAQGAETQSASE